MAYAEQMLEAHPWPGHVDREVLARCTEACVECSQACTACADASLGEEDVVDMRRCIRLCLDCADICDTTGRVLTRQTEYDAPSSRAQLESCLEICRTCAEECGRHAQHHEHCRICEEACRRCEEACGELLAAMS